MKRIGNLYDSICSFENLLSAFKKASRAASKKKATLNYFYNLEKNLLLLREKLLKETYTPGKYWQFTITDPKKRVISVAPFEDRIVHHAIVNILEPIYERRFIFDSYATRKNKGTHRAVRRAQEFLRHNALYLKTDIRHYFDSIDHNILMNTLRKKIKDEKLLNLIEKIIQKGGSCGKGLPIGNLTSQFFANCYLDVFDHIIKDESQEKYYIRYMDDMLFFSNDKEHLKDLRIYIHFILKEKFVLDLKEKATYINRRENGCSFLGTRVFPNTIRIKKENLKRSVKHLKENEQLYQKGKLSQNQFECSINSIIGHLSQYDTLELRRIIFG